MSTMVYIHPLRVPFSSATPPPPSKPLSGVIATKIDPQFHLHHSNRAEMISDSILVSPAPVLTTPPSMPARFDLSDDPSSENVISVAVVPHERPHYYDSTVMMSVDVAPVTAADGVNRLLTLGASNNMGAVAVPRLRPTLVLALPVGMLLM